MIRSGFNKGNREEAWSLHSVTEKDFDDIIGLYQLCFPLGSIGRWSEKNLLDTLSLTTTKGLLLTSDTNLSPHFVGFAIFQVVGEETELLSFGVNPEMQNKGIGKLFLKKIMSEFISSKCQKIFLEVDSENSAAISIYKYLGFQILTKRIDYYKGEGRIRHDCLVMALNIK